MLRAYTGPPYRQRVCISYDTKTSHYFRLSLDREERSLLSSSYSSPARNARGHVTTIMPILPPLSRSLLVLLLVLLRNLLPSFVSSFTSHLSSLGYISYLELSYPLNQSKRKRLYRLINCNARHSRPLPHVSELLFTKVNFAATQVNQIETKD